jgi:hypothetical protein
VVVALVSNFYIIRSVHGRPLLLIGLILFNRQSHHFTTAPLHHRTTAQLHYRTIATLPLANVSQQVTMGRRKDGQLVLLIAAVAALNPAGVRACDSDETIWTGENSKFAFVGGTVVFIIVGIQRTFEDSKYSKKPKKFVNFPPEVNSTNYDIDTWYSLLDDEHNSHELVTLVRQSGIDDNIIAVAWSPDGTAVATARNDDGKAFVWNLTEGTVGGMQDNWLCGAQSTDYDNSHCARKRATSVAWSPDGQKLAVSYGLRDDAVGSERGGVELWDIASRFSTHLTCSTCGQFDVTAVSWSPNGQFVAAATKFSRE